MLSIRRRLASWEELRRLPWRDPIITYLNMLRNFNLRNTTLYNLAHSSIALMASPWHSRKISLPLVHRKTTWRSNYILFFILQKLKRRKVKRANAPADEIESTSIDLLSISPFNILSKRQGKKFQYREIYHFINITDSENFRVTFFIGKKKQKSDSPWPGDV